MTYLEEIFNKIGPSGLSELDLIARGWTFERVFVTKHKEEIPVYRKKKWLAYVHTDGTIKMIGGLPELRQAQLQDGPANVVQVLSMSERLALGLRAELVEVLPKGAEEVYPEFIEGELE